MTGITMKEAINMALKEEMASDPDVFLMGEDIGIYGGAFGVTAGLLEEFGPQRVIETPISEASLAGIATGASLMGLRPVLEIMFMDFSTLIMDQLLNHAVKLKYMFGGKDGIKVPMVIRTPFGGGRAYGASHSQSLEAFFLHMPGLKIFVPSNPSDACGLLKHAIRDDNPVLFMENKLQYSGKGELNREILPPGRAKIVTAGNDITMLSYGRMLDECIKAGEILKENDYRVEIIDLRTLNPLDRETIYSSVAKTGRVIIVEEGTLTSGVGAEISSLITENCFFDLDAPPLRVSALDVPIPYSPALEAQVLPSAGKIARRAMSLL